MTLLRWMFQSTEEWYWKSKTWVFCRKDQFNFSLCSFRKFDLDWEKLKALWRQFSHICWCGLFLNSSNCNAEFDLFQMIDDGEIFHIWYFLFRLCNQSKILIGNHSVIHLVVISLSLCVFKWKQIRGREGGDNYKIDGKLLNLRQS